ncbi:hypothetical protein [Desulfotomaculum copahuensis]|uniref:hypothetical protein n=1 Tax=Desulfotomaculum copahuensis TaxID=1838280 RepID=UPI00098EF735|nr:hypothetical protein [Desulfotomaculum copahuensis]
MLPVVINIFWIKVNVVQTGAVLGVGQNFMPEWRAFNKTNNGVGSQYGDACSVTETNACVDDSDFMDFPVLQQRQLLAD